MIKHNDFTSFDEFCKNFNIVDNALHMRTLMRWNGRDLMNRENLAEHTHLVVACIFELIDEIRNVDIDFKVKYRSENLIRAAMLHDSLELLRGDILSVTKDAIAGLREAVDEEERKFTNKFVGSLTDTEVEILTLADIKACVKFLEWELRYPSNEVAKDIYTANIARYEKHFKDFCIKYGLNLIVPELEVTERYIKGYKNDAGVDIILDKDVTFLPMSTTTFDLNLNVKHIEKNTMAFLCARTSAAQKGLCVAVCPIDPDYIGTITAIVHNVSNEIISYKKGESFCQLVVSPIITQQGITCKMSGKRSDGRLGSTGR